MLKVYIKVFLKLDMFKRNVRTFWSGLSSRYAFYILPNSTGLLIFFCYLIQTFPRKLIPIRRRVAGLMGV